MAYGFLDIVTTPRIRAIQEEMGSDRVYRDFRGHRESDRFTENERDFIAGRDMFFLASVGEGGWPYVQHRGGPPGFLKVIDETTLAFADYRGNRQYVSAGNISGDGRVALILPDLARRARLKILAHARIVPLGQNAELEAAVFDPDYRAVPERIIHMQLAAFDWNCPQHITPRLTPAEMEAGVTRLRDRCRALEQENALLRAQLTGRNGE
ncbi:hypothetical protein FHS61_001227 [Altererythrobacter atlanticus]|uniref:Pyridoxamine 5'-phosphate oxidase n=1 Tax=Croceibacterium atlanticum TaxID=1267766 RepID=A0A0F7KU14_9SPHN|nr:pyridoxamine 5'-phosphate oxidase family protein [Croceibacterium atlanticum]AKH43074.1 Pyridoxamine 5'-phosphate oxidase [Croceibacterium atlanticum]MBB5732223.1 hypothetical protein [Croceibacterium atlanticum]